ncbi:MAG: hypothetical protein IIA41_05395, partial [SAR324 cluster bacterium]|nr:hypothetical protein [SAR324 cluster bacterium]
YKIVSLPQNGVLTGTPPNLTYTPALNFNGSDSFTFQADDGEVAISAIGNVGTVTITVNPVNDAPIAFAQTKIVPVNASSEINLTGTDVANSPLTFEILQWPSKGALTGSPPNLTTARRRAPARRGVAQPIRPPPVVVPGERS